MTFAQVLIVLYLNKSLKLIMKGFIFIVNEVQNWSHIIHQWKTRNHEFYPLFRKYCSYDYFLFGKKCLRYINSVFNFWIQCIMYHIRPKWYVFSNAINQEFVVILTFVVFYCPWDFLFVDKFFYYKQSSRKIRE